ncbi:hypothetical protein FDO65_08175 [Nakamurella flava]|uniref:Uncharacterized protein n=1 Tax=Nakamurella flava TaxID=2576308 RepID=A0A4V6CSU3_9ACTN|nr:hypothetical protein [Nakamurella flava]TKV61535.1 hypothetical protein FDO65_08175 [Nakamurella flava]
MVVAVGGAAQLVAAGVFGAVVAAAQDGQVLGAGVAAGGVAGVERFAVVDVAAVGGLPAARHDTTRIAGEDEVGERLGWV